jgi:hypothetical protein
MAKNYDTLFESVLELPKAKRLSFAEAVLASVIPQSVPPSLMISDEDIMRRADEVRTGKAKLVDAFESLDRIRAKLKRERAKKAL